MPQPVDVGSVLGGRYKVTAYVLASADRDLVLDGMDQVLNRPVSILVASTANADQIAATAREVATGERAGSIQVLDLGVTESATYLVTNRASAADLLDLVIPQDAPYIEPFFTDTLGSEIFGGPRSTEPEMYDDDDEEDDEDDERPARRSRLSKARLPRFGKGAAGGAAAAGAGAVMDSGEGETRAEQRPTPATPAGSKVPPPPTARPRVPAEDQEVNEQNPKVSLWSDDDYGSVSEDRRDSATGQAVAPAASGQSGRAASRFPVGAAAGGGAGSDDYDDDGHEYEEDDRENNPKYTRVLVGVLLAIILVTVVVLASNQLSSNFAPDPAAGPDTTTTAPTQEEADPTEDDQTTPPAEEESPEPTEEPVEPVATAVTRLVPGNPELNAQSDGDLPLIIDDNPGSFWGSLVFADETFGGFAENMALVVELEEESAISQIQIQQLNGSGGNFTVLLNDEPAFEGATEVAQSSFTGPTTNFLIPADGEGQPVTAQYVIINFTQLPRLSNIQAVFPWGLRIAEINIS